MKKVFIIHGMNSSPNKAWRPWLMAELAKKDIWACSLAMPGDEDPICDEWVTTIKEATKEQKEVYLVGHSLGVRAVLRYLEEGNSVKGVVLVSGRFGKPSSGILESFYGQQVDFNKVKQHANTFVVIHGDNDPNVPYEDGKRIAENLGCELVTILGGGHLSGKAQCFELPEVRDALLAMMK